MKLRCAFLILAGALLLGYIGGQGLVCNEVEKKTDLKCQWSIFPK